VAISIGEAVGLKKVRRPVSPLGLTSNSGNQSHNLKTLIGLLLLTVVMKPGFLIPVGKKIETH